MAEPTSPAGTRRFYKEAGFTEAEGGFALTLDGRRARTPARADLVLPTRALAEALAAEWQAQGASIDPTTMPLTRLANSTIDGVLPRLGEVRDDLLRYAGSDLVFYRAASPERLVAEQSAAWDPVHAYARDFLGAHFVLSEGVMFVQQPADAIEAVRRVVEGEGSAFVVAGLHVMTTLTGSVLIALMRAAGRLTIEAAWQAAHVDELFQESRWGEDYEAGERRRGRETEFRSASSFVDLSRG